MNENISMAAARSLILQRFSEAGIRAEVEARDYPEETIFVVTVPPGEVERAAEVGNSLDSVLEDSDFRGFVTVRAGAIGEGPQPASLRRGVNSPSVNEFVKLLTARSRASKNLPSLQYVPDRSMTISAATSSRHHLIFGRRGAGKTALMLEAMERLLSDGHLAVWLNVHTYRNEPHERLFLHICQDILDQVQIYFRSYERDSDILLDAVNLRDEISSTIGASTSSEQPTVEHLFPRINRLVERFLTLSSSKLFVFLDDFHYLNREDQPVLLDSLHAALRDTNVWLKVAAIRHLSRWYDSSSHQGLETGHDAGHINLDISLEDPVEAKVFLEKVLRSYAETVGITAISKVLSRGALDRLVLASGAVPRDYLELSATSIRNAQKRTESRLVGIQDVNRAAGDEASLKIQEVEEDAATTGEVSQVLGAMQEIRAFCLNESGYTFFRVDFEDKENHPSRYNNLQTLLDLRLLHLVNPSLSHEREAGKRSEVFMLDLSEFSGDRLRQGLKVLDFTSENLVLKETGTKGVISVGDSARKLVGLLRRGPEFPLSRLGELEL